MQRSRFSWIPLLALGVPVLVPGALPALRSGEPAGRPLSIGQLDSLQQLIRPQPGEAKWARVPWLTDLHQARQQAVKEDKPLFVWRAGGGEVLGRA
jgi:hypothetical protein